jgi:hypothetical protein
MIIEHTPQSEKGVTDTNKLSDVEAMILEKAEELRKLCFDTSRQAIIVVDAKGEENGGGYQFWNMKLKSPDMKDVKDGEQIRNDTEDKNRAYENILQMANQFTMALTGGQVGVVPVKTVNDMAKTLAAYHSTIETLKAALKEIAEYDEQSIWNDDRDDAADGMLSVARKALGIPE